MAEGEAGTSYMAASERACEGSEGGRTPYKTIRSRENSLIITRTAWGTCPHDPLTSLPLHVGITGPSLNMWELQIEMSFE